MSYVIISIRKINFYIEKGKIKKMRILVFSDTHKRIDDCIRVIERIKDVDMIIHAGDHASDAKELQKMFLDIPVWYVRGNCDFTYDDEEIIVEAEDKKIMVTHGHLYNVKNDMGYATLKEKAKKLGADIVVFGHTHIPYNENLGDLFVLNPGSVKSGRTFGVIEVENGKIGTAVCDCGGIM